MIKKYVFDYRPQLIEANITEGTFDFENSSRPNIDIDKVVEGMHLYMFADKAEGTYGFFEVEITHIYAGVYFYRFVGETEEHYFPKSSILAQYDLYPMEILTVPGVNFKVNCPYTKIVTNESN